MSPTRDLYFVPTKGISNMLYTAAQPRTASKASLRGESIRKLRGVPAHISHAEARAKLSNLIIVGAMESGLEKGISWNDLAAIEFTPGHARLVWLGRGGNLCESRAFLADYKRTYRHLHLA